MFLLMMSFLVVLEYAMDFQPRIVYQKRKVKIIQVQTWIEEENREYQRLVLADALIYEQVTFHLPISQGLDKP